MNIADQVLMCVVSHDRPYNVARMNALYSDWVWVVNDDDQALQYEIAGADRVLVSGAVTKSLNMNYAMDVALEAGKLLLVSDDDITGLYTPTGTSGKDVKSVSVEEVTSTLAYYMCTAGAYMAASTVGSNPMFAKQRVHTWAYIHGPFRVFDPKSDERFLPEFEFFEDCEMTCRHLRRYGLIVRVDWLMCDHLFSVGSGGMNQHRTRDKVRAGRDAVLRKYPDMVQPHPTNSVDVKFRHNARNIPSGKARAAYEELNG